MGTYVSFLAPKIEDFEESEAKQFANFMTEIEKNISKRTAKVTKLNVKQKFLKVSHQLVVNLKGLRQKKNSVTKPLNATVKIFLLILNHSDVRGVE